MNGFSYLIKLFILFYTFYLIFISFPKQFKMKNERKSKPTVLNEINLKAINSIVKVSEIKTN